MGGCTLYDIVPFTVDDPNLPTSLYKAASQMANITAWEELVDTGNSTRLMVSTFRARVIDAEAVTVANVHLARIALLCQDPSIDTT